MIYISFARRVLKAYSISNTTVTKKHLAVQCLKNRIKRGNVYIEVALRTSYPWWRVSSNERSNCSFFISTILNVFRIRKRVGHIYKPYLKGGLWVVPRHFPLCHQLGVHIYICFTWSVDWDLHRCHNRVGPCKSFSKKKEDVAHQSWTG